MGKHIHHLYGSLSLCVALFFNLLDHTVLGYHEGEAYRFNKIRPFLIANRGRGHMGSGNQDKSNIFNVLDFGARGDGSSYDNQAFEGAWAAACEANGGVMVVPSEYTFLLQPIIFNGDKCQPNVVVQVDGKIDASSDKSDWKGKAALWILFERCKRGLTIRGNGGVLDGHGEAWWGSNVDYIHSDDTDHNKLFLPNALTISNSINVKVTGITIQNSPRMHISIEQSQQVEVDNLTISSPGDSKNTDGIHVSRSQHVDIHNSILACGDDCVSIQTGCFDVQVYDVHCGPGHGYSIGGLGANGREAQVSDIIIRDSSVQDSLTGVRIKTWEGGSGSVKNVTFSNITMSNVKTPITIDQHYCGGGKSCNIESSAVAITSITYQNITGTYSHTSVSLMCSDQEPCRNLTLADIQLTPTEDKKKSSDKGPYCSNAYGQVLTKTLPPLDDCLL